MRRAEVIGKVLKKNYLTLSVAESCTGGLVCDQLTDVPGSSSYIQGGVVAYNALVKKKVLRVSGLTIRSKGVVSKEVASEMADGVRKLLKTSIGISTTGVAGPSGGTEKNPVGTVWIAVSSKKETRAKKVFLGKSRREIKRKAAQAALSFLYSCLLEL